jgi:hypothetical protein
MDFFDGYRVNRESHCIFILPEGLVVFCETYGDRSFCGDRAHNLFVDAPVGNSGRSERAAARSVIARNDTSLPARQIPMIYYSTLSRSTRPLL